MKKLFWVYFLIIIILPSSAKAKVKEIEIYQHKIFIVEEFPLKAGLNRLILAKEVSPEEINFRASSGLRLISISLEKVSKKDLLSLNVKKLREKLDALERDIETLNREISLVEDALKGKRETPSPQVFESYHQVWKKLFIAKLAKEKERETLKKQLKELESQIVSLNTSALIIQVKGQGSFQVRYPAGKLISWRENYECLLNTQDKELFLRAMGLITQKSGNSWPGVKIIFYPRGEDFAVLKPPPFTPWIVDEFSPRPKLLLRKTVEAVKEIKREKSPGNIWERVTVSYVDLPSGKPTAISLGEETFKVEKFLLEAPVYAVNKAFFRADLIPDRSFPRLKARFYLDGALVGEGEIGPLNPGISQKVYFGPASLIEIKRVVLKDVKGDSFFGKKTRLREVKTVFINHYDRPFDLEIIDKVPISRKKEVKIKAQANPPWQEKHPDGKVIWRFNLPPNGKQEIILRVEIKRPKDE
ncbi:hypothetical protein Thein_0614 [Thermodesulfatator indicus DSM 15286]|uniref:DUF4139 domain-containing protein n=1 Tax=Thermodesulfatator indicus (strain DSM 15286 / JCM 11887 / CIR29812) TaxID=667014 RepID=F8ABP3_THEID|nr:DUF4139 domain-containing protein [Thermodesulfatator indicus]AEH44495.1 hypothetical protein Thein_0614 [Thermodesulfatator indicus DSM 15286]